MCRDRLVEDSSCRVLSVHTDSMGRRDRVSGEARPVITAKVPHTALVERTVFDETDAV